MAPVPKEFVLHVHAIGPEGSQTRYLVDAHGKLVYYFFPHGTIDYSLAKDWPEPTRSWVRLWKPVLVGTQGPVDLPSELAGESLSGVERRGEGTFQVNWGGEKTKDATGVVIKFWRLYTYAFDRSLDSYKMRDGDAPPGMVPSLWEPVILSSGAPAPTNAQRLGQQGGPIGNNVTGGP